MYNITIYVQKSTKLIFIHIQPYWNIRVVTALVCEKN